MREIAREREKERERGRKRDENNIILIYSVQFVERIDSMHLMVHTCVVCVVFCLLNNMEIDEK